MYILLIRILKLCLHKLFVNNIIIDINVFKFGTNIRSRIRFLSATSPYFFGQIDGKICKRAKIIKNTVN